MPFNRVLSSMQLNIMSQFYISQDRVSKKVSYLPKFLAKKR